MKKSVFAILTLVVCFVVLFASCGKYEEGPGLSIRSKKGRVAGEWTVEKALSNGSDVTSFFSGYVIIYEKDGSYTAKYPSFPDEKGTWEFDGEKEKLITTDSSGDKDTSTIIRLKNKEMWFKDVSGGNTFELHLAQ
jgi:hypothetical protein